MIKLEEKSVLKKKTELLTPKIDVVFHALFRQSNKQLAEKFISAILGEKVKIKRVDLDRHLEIQNANEKLGVMDYRAELIDDSNCIIEIQLLEKKAERAFAIEKGLEEGRQRGLEEGRAYGIAEGKAKGIE